MSALLQNIFSSAQVFLRWRVLFMCITAAQLQKQRPSSLRLWTVQLISDAFCLSVIELIWSRLNQRLTHIPLSWYLITPSLFELLKTTHPPNKTSPRFPQRDLAWFTLWLRVCVTVCVRLCVWPCILVVCTLQVDVAWFYRNCLTDTCNCNRGGDCECLCTSIAAYAHKCCQQGVTIRWRSPSVCREYTHRHIHTCSWCAAPHPLSQW